MNNPVIEVNEDVKLEVTPDVQHEYVLTNAQVAEGYGITAENVRYQKRNHVDELKENKHWVVRITNTPGGKQKTTYWTKRGVVRLGFFIRSPRAKAFRDAAEIVGKPNARS